jgi:hypothetical protein
MSDLSNYRYFKHFKSPIMDYIDEHYNNLKTDFFNNVAQSRLLGNKPAYTFSNGVTELYRGKIQSVGLKFSKIAIDDDEKRIMQWGDNEEYRYNYNRAWSKLTGDWVNFVKAFDNQLEQMFFNIAWPGATITPHKGINSRYFRVHVCLQENDGFHFDIEGEKKYWKEGVRHAFAFDDANLKHGVFYNEQHNPNPRVVAILDVKKECYPELFRTI